MPDTDSSPNSDPAIDDKNKVDKGLPSGQPADSSGGSTPGTNDIPKSDKGL